MYNPVRIAILSFLKVPPEPHPPAGSPGSLRVFRAGKNYFKLRLAGWGVTQLLALAGIVFWVVVLVAVVNEVERRKAIEPEVAPLSKETFREAIESLKKEAEAQQNSTEPNRVRVVSGFKTLIDGLVELAMRLPDWAFPLIWVLKIGAILIYLVQIPITYFLRRLDYEMRWYIVTDRSLRLRWGVSKVYETTMSFANLQQVEVSQNPVQRVLALGDVRVQSAGGGNSPERHAKNPDESMHRARFHAVENADEIRDLILERLRRFRQAGLGDPDDPHHDEEPESPRPAPGTAVDAAHELLAETRALRAAL